MLHDINQYGVHREHKTTTTLKAMTKAELIEYIRMLEHDYNVAVDFNERQARNIKQMMKDGKLAEVIRCKECIRHGDEHIGVGRSKGMIVSNRLESYNIYDQLNKAIDTLEKYTEENLTQEEIDRRNCKFAGVQFVKSEVNKE